MPSTPTRILGSAMLLALVVAAPTHANAQSPDGRFKLGIETALFEYTTTTVDAGGVATTTDNSASEVSFGIVPARSGLDLGYGLSDSVVLGTRLLLVHNSQEQPGAAASVDATVFGFLPHLDYVFPSRSSTRVFLGPLAGFGIADAQQVSAHLFIFGANFGAHIFASKGVSIDPRLVVSYALGEESYDINLGGLLPALGVSADIHVIAVSVMLGISAWL